MSFSFFFFLYCFYFNSGECNTYFAADTLTTASPTATHPNLIPPKPKPFPMPKIISSPDRSHGHINGVARPPTLSRPSAAETHSRHLEVGTLASLDILAFSEYLTSTTIAEVDSFSLSNWFYFPYFSVSDASRSTLYAAGSVSRCSSQLNLNSSVSSRLYTCLRTLPNGDYIFRISSGYGDDMIDVDATYQVTWSFCGLSGGPGVEFAFGVYEGSCIPLSTVLTAKSIADSSTLTAIRFNCIVLVQSVYTIDESPISRSEVELFGQAIQKILSAIVPKEITLVSWYHDAQAGTLQFQVYIDVIAEENGVQANMFGEIQSFAATTEDILVSQLGSTETSTSFYSEVVNSLIYDIHAAGEKVSLNSAYHSFSATLEKFEILSIMYFLGANNNENVDELNSPPITSKNEIVVPEYFLIAIFAVVGVATIAVGTIFILITLSWITFHKVQRNNDDNNSDENRVSESNYSDSSHDDETPLVTKLSPL